MSLLVQMKELQREVRTTLLAEAVKQGKDVSNAVEVCMRASTARHRRVIRDHEEIDALFDLWEDLDYTIHNFISRQ
jgi:hypothetical protein